MLETSGLVYEKIQLLTAKIKTISRRVLVCSNEGKSRQHPRGSPLKRRLHARTGCEAKLVIKLQNDDSKYSIVEFVEKHNHVLTRSDQVHMLRSQRKIESSQARLIENMHYAGISQKNIFAYLSVESGGYENLNFTQMDCYNHIQRRRRQDILKKGDAEHLLEYFQEMQKDNPYFFYAIEMDATGQLCSCFWSDDKCRMDYSFFGDVLVFDTTFGTNEYDKPFSPFVGVNNHGQTTLFGCALLLDESTDSFVWLFKTFLSAMNGKHPQKIFTDQAEPIMNAIKQVFPGTHHRLCFWHIFQLAAKHLSHIFVSSEFFTKYFKRCIYKNKTEEEFESMCKSFLEKYKLTENKWLQTLYKKKEKWAQVYGQVHFCAGMTTTQRSEGMNNFLKKYFKRTLSLKSFVVEYDKVLDSRRAKEKTEDFKSMQRKPTLHSHWALEVRAAERYPTKMFAYFQKEYKETLDLILEIIDQDGSIYTYKVTSFKFSSARTVTFNSSDNSVQCSCKHFQFMGMICAHSMNILHTHQVYDLPSQYFLSRWTTYAKNGVGIEEPKKPI
ncbi:protein FAR1-RELATED SEQUENCE 5-like [Papaver somniferum]|uniref:protein FAR1-RELATED SEQUENCE 5-like n=1 Tax=Papaver somniferum TaxID=3469 RepID=UPI000E700ADC|nr:protein FAR1-RELATED SEQUENCE 5-like [Papaver somniferum]